MNPSRNRLILAALVLTASRWPLAVSSATPLFSWSGPGTSAFPLLRVGQGVRAAALADASLALGGNAGSIYSNPAGLGGISEFQLSLEHHQWLSDLKNEVAHIALPTGSGSLGLGLLYGGDSDIEGRDENNQPLPSFGTWEAAGTIGYGARLSRSACLGLSAKVLWQTAPDFTGQGGGLDLGFSLRPFSSLNIGLAARNFGFLYYGNEGKTLPSELGLGASWTGSGFTAVADFIYPLDSRPNLRAGVEYLPVRQLALRLGYRTGPADIFTLGLDAGLTAGLGINLGGFSLDYCFAPYGKLGPTHRIGFILRSRSTNPGQVLITVTDAKTHEPLWATLALSGVKELRTGTNRSGQLRLSSLPTGLLIIRTSREGYETRVDTMEILGVFPQNASIALSVLDRGEIWGILYDAKTGRTVGGTVSYKGPVYGEQQVDSKLGSFALKNLPSGSYVLTALGPDSSYSAQTCTLQVTKNRISERLFYLYRSDR